MGTPWILVELACGSAALTRHVLGGTKLVSYQGGKQGYAKQIASYLHISDPPAGAVLVDPGPWGEAWKVLSVPASAATVADCLEYWSDVGDKVLWDWIRADPPKDPIERAAAFLFLQAREWGGKPASFTKTAGFKPEEYPEAWNTPTRHAGRWDNPRPVLAARLRAMASLPWPPVTVLHTRADLVDPSRFYGDASLVVYIDPPYRGATGYAHDWPRESVVTTAQMWRRFATCIAVSEAEPLEISGWRHAEITTGRAGQYRVRSKQRREFLTYTSRED